MAKAKKRRRTRAKKPKRSRIKKHDSLVTCAEFARLKGVSVRAVYKAIESGRIACELVNGKQRIEPKQAYIDWDRNTKERQELDSEESPEIDDDVDADQDGDINKENAREKMRIAEARKAIWDARQAKLKFLKDTGELVAMDKVRKEAFELAKIVKDRFLGIPNRISAELVGIRDQAKMHGVLTRELTQILDELVHGLEGIESG